jgi:GTP-binding protein
MRFIDEVKLTIISGNGGEGVVRFRREKYVPEGGPSGGNGGKGGDVIFQADENINTLVHFRGRKIYQAENGEKGGNTLKDGKWGEDLIIRVPVGTIVRDQNHPEIIFADLKFHNDSIVLAKGGRGGLGNAQFKTSTNQAPRHAQPGEEGQTLELFLELKLLADLALIGLPNAGKSTLIARISDAKPKIADYPFTTLIPNLGLVKYQEHSFVVADIPGLIENASEGKGLGVQFLKHIERTKALVHLVDCSMSPTPYEAYEDYVTVRAELLKFNAELDKKKELICLTKTDAMNEEEKVQFKAFFEDQLDKKVVLLSSVSGENVEILKSLMFKVIEDYKAEN